MHQLCSKPLPLPDPRPIDAAATRLQRAWDGVLGLYRRQAQRRALAGLDDHLLRDIGITRAQARAEAARPFWR